MVYEYRYSYTRRHNFVIGMYYHLPGFSTTKQLFCNPLASYTGYLVYLNTRAL
ncbi:hypothetical protein IF2G_07531 [Cordyceps javanica]|nr:hypothetical protein IF2G_07531 [Cordyceps javanica]